MPKPPIGPATRLCMSLAARPGPFGSRFHNRLYEAMGLDYVYKAFTTTDLPAAIGGVRALGIRGCAISMPFKEAVIPLLDGLEGSAAAIDSVNTIVNDDGRLIGHNTDYSAIMALIRPLDPATPTLLRGSGGMAKAVAAALRDSGFTSVTLIARNAAAGRPLADLYGFAWAPTPEAAAAQGSRPDGLPAGLLINATPIGMAGGPKAETLAFPDPAIAAATTVFDVVALPVETPLLKAARAYGRRRITGAEVAMLQALDQFVLYTGIRPDAALAEEAAAWARAG